MDCVEDDETDTEAVVETGSCPILATGLCKSSDVSVRAGGWGTRDDAWGDESEADRLFSFPLVVLLVLELLLLLELFLEGGLLGLLLLFGDLSLSVA